MNHPFVAERAAHLTTSLCNSYPQASIIQLYAEIFQRKPTGDELQLALEFLQSDMESTISKPAPSQWSYGYGEFDPASGRVLAFTPLPHFSGTAWQGGDSYPDPKLGWLKLDATGGHPGNDRKHAIVRRWTSTMDGSFSIASNISHEPEAGDGIRAFVSHSLGGLLRSATVHHATEQIDVESVPVKKGDTLDFIVDIRDGLNSDQFLWSPKITQIGTTGAGGNNVDHVYDAGKDFSSESKSQLNRWEQLAQVLMLANEFMFVD